jgi:hypothetical protein
VHCAYGDAVLANAARQCREVVVAGTVYCSVCHLLVDPAGDDSEGRQSGMLVFSPVGELGLETRSGRRTALSVGCMIGCYGRRPLPRL